MRVKEITDHLESWAHPSLQEPYDNSGLLIGDPANECSSALITLDVTEEVIDEAIEIGSNLIIAHHPLIFKGIKKIGQVHWLDKCIRKAIKHDLNIYAIHTNLDNVYTGVNRKIAEKIGLLDLQILQPKQSSLVRLSVFVPKNHEDQLAAELFQVGAGKIGNYDECSFQFEGKGTFRGNESSNPFLGKAGTRENAREVCIDLLVKKYELPRVLTTMKKVHPYEEVAYFITDLLNKNQEIGSGMIGSLAEEMDAEVFLNHLKSNLDLYNIRHTELIKKRIARVAVCGGAGSFLIRNAIAKNADIFISADFKYHDFFEANNQLIIADIGHYESEVHTKDLLHDELCKTFAKFAFRLSKVDTNPIKYL